MLKLIVAATAITAKLQPLQVFDASSYEHIRWNQRPWRR